MSAELSPRFACPEQARGIAFLHMGMPKTGSSAMQSQFMANAAHLARQGIAFPFRAPEARSMQRGATLGNAPMLADYPRPRRFRRGYREALDVLLAEACPNVLLSSEMFWYTSPTAFAQVVAHIRSHALHPAAILYLRAQTSYLPAIWFTDILYAGESRSLSDYVLAQIDSGTLLYHARVARLVALLGRDAVEVRLYDRRTLRGARTELDFAALLGIDTGCFEGAVADAVSNPTPDYEVIERLRALPADVRLKQYRAVMRAHPDSSGLNSTDPARKLRLPASLHARVAAHVVRDNSALSRDYLAGTPLICPPAPQNEIHRLHPVGQPGPDASPTRPKGSVDD